MADPIDMGKAFGRVVMTETGEMLVYPTDYFEQYIGELVEQINDLDARVTALETP